MSSTASFSYSLCGIVTSTAVQYILKFLASGRAWTNSSQPPFSNGGYISLFSCQWDPRNLASRLLKFGLARSVSVEISVSNTVRICCVIITQTTTPGCYLQLTLCSPLWENRTSGTNTGPASWERKIHFFLSFTFWIRQNLFFYIKMYLDVSPGQTENTVFAVFKSVIRKKKK